MEIVRSDGSVITKKLPGTKATTILKDVKALVGEGTLTYPSGSNRAGFDISEDNKEPLPPGIYGFTPAPPTGGPDSCGNFYRRARPYNSSMKLRKRMPASIPKDHLL